jgi:hypothetical protein
MDIEREIDSVQIEGMVDNNFDDVILTCGKDEYYFQIKDFQEISINDLKITNEDVIIKGKMHSLSNKTNVLVFKEIDINPDTEIFGLPALLKDGIYLVSINRESVQEKINTLYENHGNRRSLIESFFYNVLDQRNLLIKRSDLPKVNVFRTNLLEETINVGLEHLKLDNLFFIEGKPGVGKSHLVNLLKAHFYNNVIYRFWTSNQDQDYETRLKFQNFIFDVSKSLFNDFKNRTQGDIINEIIRTDKVLIIDGLDHVENYNPSDLDKFIEFISSLKNSGKVIALSRPLRKGLEWDKYVLGNWNIKQTDIVLDELYHISDYEIRNQIYDLTDGYPILVKYVAEYFKKHQIIPQLDKLTDINNYYDQILIKQSGKQALAMFLCFRSYVMDSEIDCFLHESLAPIVREFVKEFPYLFEIRLNRISLFHDSLVTYLRNQNIDYAKTLEQINQHVFSSLLSGESRFLSRFSRFNLSSEQKKKVIQKYCSIIVFEELVTKSIDFEAISAFYFDIRSELENFDVEVLDIIQFYNLSLIINVVSRDHVITMPEFNYTFAKALKFNGYNEDDLTSSGFLFAMFYYIEINDSTLWYNLLSDHHYSVEYFHSDFGNSILEEESFFEKHDEPRSEERLINLLENTDITFIKERLSFCLVNIYVHQLRNEKLTPAYNAINYYIEGQEDKAVHHLSQYLYRDASYHYTQMVLEDAKKTILALGKLDQINEFRKFTLEELIHSNREEGSFELWPKVLAYIRLSLHEKRAIDISSIGLFWVKYFQRKDYSLLSVPRAFKVFEKDGFVSLKDCCTVINQVQDISEKGYRGLFNDFIVLYPPSIIETIGKDFDLLDLRILWFQLPTEYINVLPDHVFSHALIELLRYHYSTKTMEFNEVENLIDSKWNNELRNVLSYHKFSIQINSKNPFYKRLTSEGFKIINVEKEDQFYSSNEKSLERYHQGILNVGDMQFIKANIKSPQEFAGFTNGYYATLADLEIYELFDPEEIRKNIKTILYNAILGKVNNHNLNPSLYYFPGNVLQLIDSYNVEVNRKELFESFKKFIELSSFALRG